MRVRPKRSTYSIAHPTSGNGCFKIAHIEYREAHGMRPGGFGIMLTKQLVDEVIYNEIGNEVILIKHTC